MNENLMTSLIHKLQSPLLQHTRARAEALSSFISLLSVRQNIFIALQRFCEILGLLWQWQVQIHCQKVQLFSIHFHKQELCSFILNFSAKLKLLGILNRKPSCFTSFISFYSLIISFHFSILLSTQ